MIGPTTTPNRPASSAAMRDRKRSALSLLLSTKPRRLLARSPSRGAGGTGGESSATVGSSANRMFSAPDQQLDTIGSNLIQTESGRNGPLPGGKLRRRCRQQRVGRLLTPVAAAIGGSPCPWWMGPLDWDLAELTGPVRTGWTTC